MEYSRRSLWLLASLWILGGLVAFGGVLLIVDSTGPNLRTNGTIVSTRYVEGMTTTTQIKVGETSVPIQTEIPGSWMAEVDSDVLGRVDVPVAYDNLRAGQHVYLEYHVGRLSKRAEVVYVHLPSELLVER